MSKKDNIFANTAARTNSFTFNEEVANVFDDMLVRSIPFYVEQQNLIEEIAQKFWQPDSTIIDLGCSTGTTLIRMANHLQDANDFKGFDSSEPMLEKSRLNVDNANLTNRIKLHACDLNGDLNDLTFTNASIVTICWTLQFIRPLNRDKLIKKVYDNMVDGGVLIVTDKVLTNDSDMNRFFIDFYYEFKRRNGYSDEEIMKKREALENVLIPYRVDENFELFHRCGFSTAETFFQWYNFVGFIAVKN